MKILVDADACPVIEEIERIAGRYGMMCMLFCDTNHVLTSLYSEVVTVGSGPDAVDFALINACGKGDVVVTQDYGVAAMALGKGAYAVHQSGRCYTDDNIELLLMERHMAKTLRRGRTKNHLKGPKKRTDQDNEKFERSFKELIMKLSGYDNMV